MSKMLFYVGIFFVIVFGWYGVKKIIFFWYLSRYQPPVATVTVAQAANKPWQSYLTSVGTLNAVNGVELSNETAGIVEEIRFESGQYVKKGDILLKMKTNLEDANLKSNEAKLKLASMNYEREKTLFSKRVSSQSLLDTRYAEFLQAEAAVDASRAQIQQRTITAPFDGRIGIRQVNIGQYLSPGTVIASLQSLSPLYVNFTLPEQYLAHLHLGQAVEVAINYGDGKRVKGKITAINSKVDPSTRNVSLQATIPNDQLSLYPGMYGFVKIALKSQQNVIILPQTAISYSLSGDYVFIVKDESKNKKSPNLHAYRQFVKVGERHDDEVAILSGLQAGDTVITAGQVKLQNGAQIAIDNSVNDKK